MRFPLTSQLLDEAARFNLQSSCKSCRHEVRQDGSCSLGWPNQEQRRWPLPTTVDDGEWPPDIDFCKEFELA